MSQPQFDAHDKSLQQLLQSTQAPPSPSLSTRQFAAHVQERRNAPSVTSWKLHFPLTLSAAGAMAFFFALQNPKVPVTPVSTSTEIETAWNDLNVQESVTTQWQTDPFNEENYSDDEDIETLIFADIEVSEELTQQYDESDLGTVESLDDDALERLDQILNDALKNRGG